MGLSDLSVVSHRARATKMQENGDILFLIVIAKPHSDLIRSA
jgi:hypothetical protein